MKNELGKTLDNAVVFDRPNSHSHVSNLILAEALQKINTSGKQFIQTEVDLGKIIGNSGCIKTSDDDCIVFAQRPNRPGLTRFVLDKHQDETTKIVVVLKQVEPKKYVLITSYLGDLAEVEPWDTRATPASLQFWQNHALFWDGNICQGTATTKKIW